jgi:lipoate-protein ligase B
LEAAVINLCARFGVRGERWTEHAGVWVARNQICAIGLAVQRMVSLHGIALNVSNELDYDRLINPCGLSDRGVTSLSAEVGHMLEMERVKRMMLEELGRTFDVEFEPAHVEAKA